MWLIEKLISLFWLSVVAALIYYSNFFRHLFFNDACNRPVLEIAFILYGLSASVIGYFVAYVCYIKGFTQSINEYNPALVYAATLSGVFANLLLLMGIWPVFGLKSLLLDVMLLKGFFTVASLTPSGAKGEILFLAINIAAALSGLYWEHEGILHNK